MLKIKDLSARAREHAFFFNDGRAETIQSSSFEVEPQGPIVESLGTSRWGGAEHLSYRG